MKAAAACAIAVFAICDWLWARHAGLTFSHWTQVVVLTGLLLAIGFFYGSIRRNAQLADMALWGALVAACSVAAAIFTYLTATLGFPLVDSELVTIDAGVGFRWPAWFQFVSSHPLLKTLFVILYTSLLPECAASILYFAHRSRSDRIAEFMLGALISILIAATISGIFPALGAFAHFGVPGPAWASYPSHLLALRQGTAASFSVNEFQGIITMPSYHTVLAILIIYAYRGFGRLFALALALNGLMLLSLPSEGGHYVIDVIAGVAVVAVTIAITSAAARTRWWRQLSGANATTHRSAAGKRTGGAGEKPGVSF